MAAQTRRALMARRTADPTPFGYVYVVARDFGFAPNPFHGICTLATCKPKIRKAARVGDWVIGVGGGDLTATGRCVFAMEVTAKMTFGQYWEAPEFLVKRPLRNGSLTMAVGDNIYHQTARGGWAQADSHHSHRDGTANTSNVRVDTSADSVLVSNHFYYFGRAAPLVSNALSKVGYRNSRGHRHFPLPQLMPLIEEIQRHSRPNYLMGDPFDFDRARGRYSAGTNRVTAVEG